MPVTISEGMHTHGRFEVESNRGLMNNPQLELYTSDYDAGLEGTMRCVEIPYRLYEKDSDPLDLDLTFHRVITCNQNSKQI